MAESTVNQGNLDIIADVWKNELSGVGEEFSNTASNMTNLFKEKWCSKNGQELTGEVSEALQELQRAICTLLDNTNNIITMANNNMVTAHGNPIVWAAPHYDVVPTNVTTDSTFADGADGMRGELSEIEKPVADLVSSLDSHASSMASAVSSNPPFNDSVTSAMVGNIENFKSTINTISTKLDESLQSRLGSENQTGISASDASASVFGS